MTRKTRRTLQVLILVAILFSANAFMGYSLIQESDRAITDQIRARMMDIASSAAALLDGDSLDKITAEDENIPEYKQAMTTLQAFQDNMDVAFVYLLRKVDDDTYIYIVDPDPSSESVASYGEPATFTNALVQAGKGAASVELDAYEDRWGRFYTAYCPVFDSTGEIAGIVAVDFEASWYEKRADDIRRMGIINTAASFLLAIVTLIVIGLMSRAEARHAKNLEHANRYDAITGLPNMSYFLELADNTRKEMATRNEKPAMLYMDLVNMRVFNMKRGFAEGNNLLQAVASLLDSRFGHDRCGRFGQDHFTVLTNSTNLDTRLDAFIEECSRINGGVNVPIHIGIFLDSSEGDIEVSAACDRAKAACDSIHGTLASSYVYFNEDMLAQAERRQYIIDNLDRALAENWIEVYYQPIVRSSTGMVCDEESLARWIDPERGMISPGEFVPVLEDVRLAHKLDLYVLEQTLAKMQRMAEAGNQVVSGSLNLSRADFEACDIVEEVCKRVDASGMGREMINIEITETAMSHDFDFMKDQVTRFHNLGFQVWMDDFGSEYSSLGHLQSLQFDLLKFDMHFMREFDDGNNKSKIILTELAKMALGLGIDTIAEGVETQEQVDFLRKIGCSKMQGFYFCKPLPEADVMNRCADGSVLGFENIRESDYYSTLGRVNLYDLSSITRDTDSEFQEYFDTLPMAVLECTDEWFLVLRCNKSYYHFIKTTIGDERVGKKIPYAQVDLTGDNPFIQAVRRCGTDNVSRLAVEEKLADGSTVHSFIRQVAVNPVTGAAGIAVAVLAIAKD